METAILAGGCFWCLEAAYQIVKGVTRVTSGYAGVTEVVRVEFDPTQVSYDDLLAIFWVIHDPTSRDRQGHDVGPQYRSVIFYTSPDQKAAAEASLKEAQKEVEAPIVTDVLPLRTFREAEEYHQNFFKNHPEQAYCQLVINPKLKKLKAKFSSKLAQ